MRTVTEDIGVDKAKLYLSKNPFFATGVDGTNRPLSLRHINHLASQMLLGKWRLTHQGLAFDTKGSFKDGQHRMMALVQAAEVGAKIGDLELPPKPKIKIKFNVTYGVEPDTFSVMDVGRNRTSDQILSMSGYTDAMHLSATARLIFLYRNYPYQLWRSTKVTNEQVLGTVQDTGIDRYINVARSLQKLKFIVSGVAAGYYICEEAFPQGPHEAFLTALKTGEEMRIQDPRNAFRNFVIKSSAQPGRSRRDASLHFALYIKAWNDFVAKRRRTIITFRADEKFPEPVKG